MKPNSGRPQRRETNPPLLPIHKTWPVATAIVPEIASRGETASDGHPVPRVDQDRASVPLSSSCGDHEGCAGEACPSSFTCRDCAEVLHELANLMTGVQVNAQVLGWKLPPYSHLKRPVREVERSAQRGGELLKRLVQRCGARG